MNSSCLSRLNRFYVAKVFVATTVYLFSFLGSNDIVSQLESNLYEEFVSKMYHLRSPQGAKQGACAQGSVKISKYYESPTIEELFGSIRGKVKYSEDLTTPTTEEWGEVLTQTAIITSDRQIKSFYSKVIW